MPTAVQMQPACVASGGGLGPGSLSPTSSCRIQYQHAGLASHTGAAEGAVEMDPARRYIRYPILLGRGACKRVYKAFDLQEGIEVAWNKAELSAHDMDPEQQERLFAEIRVLKTLKHRNIITCYDWWHDAPSQTINFITEYFTSGTLRQYRKKHLRHISEMAIKRWAFQILEGLLYLHAHSPPIVHRDLKCDNILVNGTSGQVKIADLGLASCQRGMSVVGTPEFMAPEMYDEVYDEKVDIYAFGMCMLELATLEYPYSECRSIPAIFMRVSKGIPPAALSKVSSSALRELITTCINSDPQQRPGALQLLKHAFFADLAERPCGSPTHGSTCPSSRYVGCFAPPFGSCGNLMALPHGTISHMGSITHQSCCSSHPHSSDGGDSSAHAAAEASSHAAVSSSGTCSGSNSNNNSCFMACSSSTACHCDSHATQPTNTIGAAPAAGISRPDLPVVQQAPGTAAATGAGVGRRSSRFLSSTDVIRDAATPPAAAAAAAATSAAVVAPTRRSYSSSDAVPAASVGAASGGGGGTKMVNPTASRMMEAAAMPSGAQRGRTVCVAAVLGRPDQSHDEEDSDDEVLVHLEDVLTPHPQDLADAEALGLTAQLTHAASGCTIMSSPGYQLADSLSGLLEHMAMSAESAAAGEAGAGPLMAPAAAGGLLSRFASSVAVLQQQQQLLAQLQQQESQELQQQESQELQQDEAESHANGLLGCTAVDMTNSSGSCHGAAKGATGNCTTTTSSSSRLGSISGMSPAMLRVLPSVLAAAGGGGGGCSSSSAAASAWASSCASGALTPLVRPASASAASGNAATVAAAAARLFSGLSLFGSSSATGGGQGGGGNSSGAGLLAAAGLLQVTPGCFVQTPTLLGKLLTRTATTARGTLPSSAAGAASTSGALTPVMEVGATAMTPAAAPAAVTTTSVTEAGGRQCNDHGGIGLTAALPPPVRSSGAHRRSVSREEAAAFWGLRADAGQQQLAAVSEQPYAAAGMMAGNVGCGTQDAAAGAGSIKADDVPAAALGATAQQRVLAAESTAGIDLQAWSQQAGEQPAAAAAEAATSPKSTQALAACAAGPALLSCHPSLCHKGYRATVDAADTAAVAAAGPVMMEQPLGECRPDLEEESAAAAAAAAGVMTSNSLAGHGGGAAGGAAAAAAGGGGGGGFGRILVRRRFLKNLQQPTAITPIKRYNTF